MMKKKFFIRTAAIAAALIIMPIQSAFAVSELVPVGKVAGISIETEGAIVLNVAEVHTGEGAAESPAHEAGIIPGDVVVKVGNKDISTADELKSAIGKSKGKTVSVTVMRGERKQQVAVTPVLTDDGYYEIGVWLRDAMAGFGTITFYDPESGIFGALGHGVSDIDTGILIPHREGDIMRAAVTDIIPGMPGKPGQLHGTFSYDDIVGHTTKNTEGGLFGALTDASAAGEAKALPVASDSDIHLGEAYIMSNIKGDTVCEYKVEITRLYTGLEMIGRNMMITITDDTLLDLTGGIVQGMSGSPIIQDGKIIGAVTHVLINNPTKGYGISIQNMLDEAYGEASTLAA
ncbi:MAG: SpoIVB peptidase [Oscillospiraceae bacterium]